MPSQKECLAIAARMFNNRRLDEQAKPRVTTGKVVSAELLGHLNYWNEKGEFGFINARVGGESCRVFCHNSAFRTNCDVNDAVKFDVWLDTSTGQRKAINVQPAKESAAPAKEPAAVAKGISTAQPKAITVAPAKPAAVKAINVAPAKPAAVKVTKGLASKEELRQARDGQFYSHISFLAHYGRDGRGELMWQEAADKVKMFETDDDVSTCADSESIADDASCVAPIPIAQPDWQPVERKSRRQEIKVPQISAKRQPQQPQQQGFYRKQCNCCLLPGEHFADKCIGIQMQVGFAERQQKREQRAERRAVREEMRALDARLAAQRENIAALPRFL